MKTSSLAVKSDNTAVICNNERLFQLGVVTYKSENECWIPHGSSSDFNALVRALQGEASNVMLLKDFIIDLMNTTKCYQTDKDQASKSYAKALKGIPVSLIKRTLNHDIYPQVMPTATEIIDAVNSRFGFLMKAISSDNNLSFVEEPSDEDKHMALQKIIDLINDWKRDDALAKNEAYKSLANPNLSYFSCFFLYHKKIDNPYFEEVRKLVNSRFGSLGSVGCQLQWWYEGKINDIAKQHNLSGCTTDWFITRHLKLITPEQAQQAFKREFAYLKTFPITGREVVFLKYQDPSVYDSVPELTEEKKDQIKSFLSSAASSITNVRGKGFKKLGIS